MKDAEREDWFPMLDGPKIPMDLAEIIYAGYHAMSSCQSLKRLGERGGFGWDEVAHMYKDRRGGPAMRAAYEEWQASAKHKRLSPDAVTIVPNRGDAEWYRKNIFDKFPDTGKGDVIGLAPQEPDAASGGDAAMVMQKALTPLIAAYEMVLRVNCRCDDSFIAQQTSEAGSAIALNTTATGAQGDDTHADWAVGLFSASSNTSQMVLRLSVGSGIERDQKHASFIQWVYRHPTESAQGDAVDAERYRKILAASERPFPILSVCEDPENDANHKYGREHIDSLIDRMDEVQPIIRAARNGEKS